MVEFAVELPVSCGEMSKPFPPGKSLSENTHGGDASVDNLPVLHLKKNEERRLMAGHLWVYSNEVNTAKSPLNQFTPGDTAVVHSSRGKAVAMAMVNPRSLISARVYSYRRGEMLGAELLKRRIAAALSLREMLYDKPCYRLVHGEGDWLPGLIVDRFGDILVMQTNTAGMERVQQEITEALCELLNPGGIYLRNNGSVRQLEGLEDDEKCVFGDVPETTELIENELKFTIPLYSGQKTGWFYDHRENRQLLARLSPGKRVLDAYCYLGAWGLNALAGGARAVTAIDSSATAIEGAGKNATLNGFGDQWQGIKGDVTEQLKAMRRDGEKFDIVVLDPPAFIQRAKDKRKGLDKYRSVNAMAANLLEPGGLLVSGSCSHHLSLTDLQRTVLHAGRQANYGTQIIARGHQGPDHPVHAAIPESEYLKAIYARLIR